MKNSFSEVMMVIIACIIFFIYPIYSTAQKQDSILQSYVTNETTEFVDRIRTNGYISSDMYSVFEKKILQTNNSYEIKITHQHQIINPVYKENGIFTNNVKVSYTNTYEKEILNTLFNGSGSYRFSQGDYICIEIYNRNPTLAAKLQQVFYGITGNKQIAVTYGGLIRDENF